MLQGLKRPKLKHKDLDFIRSFGAVGATPVFPQEYNTDSGGMPDQNADGQPYGCTNYGQADLATDLTGVKRMPADLEAVTHANTRGGYDIRDSLDAARGLGWFKWYFNIQSYNLDWFDSIRYAQLIGAGIAEKRSVTIGTPWFMSWEQAATHGQSTLPMPTQDELTNYVSASWHDWDVKGWKEVNGVPMLLCKSWQGTHVGDNGWLYVPRDVVNKVMALKFTVAYTPTMLDAPNNFKIKLPLLDWLLSFIRNLPLNLRY